MAAPAPKGAHAASVSIVVARSQRNCSPSPCAEQSSWIPPGADSSTPAVLANEGETLAVTAEGRSMTSKKACAEATVPTTLSSTHASLRSKSRSSYLGRAARLVALSHDAALGDVCPAAAAAVARRSDEALPGDADREAALGGAAQRRAAAGSARAGGGRPCTSRGSPWSASSTLARRSRTGRARPRRRCRAQAPRRPACARATCKPAAPCPWRCKRCSPWRPARPSC